MTTSEVLLRAAELVEKGWCQQAYARNAAGDSTSAYSFAAVSFCVLGAIDRASRSGGLDDIDARFYALRRLKNGLGREPANFNDAPERTQAEVAAALRAAAEVAQ